VPEIAPQGHHLFTAKLLHLLQITTISAGLRPALAFDPRQCTILVGMFQPGQVVRVNLAGLQAEGVMFQAAVTDAVAHIVKQTSEQPPKYLVKLLFSFRGVSEVEVPADRSSRRQVTGRNPTKPPCGYCGILSG